MRDRAPRPAADRRPEYRGGATTYGHEHRAHARVERPARMVAEAVAIGLATLALWLAAIPTVGKLWGHALAAVAPALGADGVRMVLTDVLGVTVGVPALEMTMGAPGTVQLFAVGFGTAVLAFATVFLPERWRPGVYLARAALLVQASAVLYFALWPDLFPYTLADYLQGMTATGLAIATATPVVLALALHVQDLSIPKKVAFTALALGYSVVLVPLQYAAQGWLIANGSALWMPLLYLFAGVPLHVFALVALYAWAMSWRGRAPALGVPADDAPAPLPADVDRAPLPDVETPALGAFDEDVSDLHAPDLTRAPRPAVGTPAFGHFDDDPDDVEVPDLAALAADTLAPERDGWRGDALPAVALPRPRWTPLADLAGPQMTPTPMTVSTAARAVVVAALCVLAAPLAAQPLTLVTSAEGRVGHAGVGGTFRTNANGTSGTTNNACLVSASSAATLAGVPSGAVVEEAYLYWAGSTGATANADWTVSLDGASVTAPAALRFTNVFDATGNNLAFFQGVADVTAAVAAKGNGTYTLAGLNIDGTDAQGSGHCTTSSVMKAWALHVIYRDASRAARSRVNLYHGFQSRYNQTATSTISGFESPSGHVSTLTYVVFEGDPNQGTGERLRFSADGGGLAVVDDTDPFNYAPHRFDGTEGPNVFGADYDVYDATGVIPASTTTGTLSLSAASDDLVYLSSVVLAMESFASDLAVAIATSDPTPAVGRTTTVTVDLSNNGPDASAGVTVDVPVPTGYTLTGSTVPPGTTYAGGVWTLPSALALGGASQLVLTLRADADAPATASATATAADRVEDDLTNNAASLTLDALPPASPSLGVTKAASATTVDVGREVTFTIVVTNPLSQNNNSVQVSDLLPSGLAYVSHTTTQGTYTPGTGVWAVGRVDSNGGTETLEVTARVTATGTRTNTATITAASRTDPDPSNNTSSASVTGVPPLAPAAGLCYAVADAGGANGGDDWLLALTRDASRVSAVGTGTGTNTIEAIAHYPDAGLGTLYAANANTFGTLNLSTGVYTSRGSFGTAGGSGGEVALTDVDGLAFDPLTGILYGSHRREGSPNLEDLLFQIDPTTGAHIPNAFGAGVDYVVIASSAAVSQVDIDDLAIDPYDGRLYAVANGSGADQLVRIDKTTGAVTAVGPLGIADVEGLAFSAPGDFFGSTGTGGGANANAFIGVSTGTGAGTVRGPFRAGTDHESVACLTDGLNTLSGTVFYDADADGAETAGDAAVPGQAVTLYRDADGSGGLSAGDPVVATTTTDANGDYAFTVAADGAFVTAAGGLLGPGEVYTTPASRAASFADFGNAATGLDLGYTDVADLALDVAVDDAAPEIGDTVTFTLTLTNEGPAGSTGVAVDGVLTGDLAFSAFQSTDGTFDAGTGRWTVAPLADGETATATITATVTGPTAGTLTAQVAAADQPDRDSTPNNGAPAEDDQDAETVTPVLPDLEVTVAADTPAPDAGDDVTFTVTLTNVSGDAGATGVTVAAPLPAGYAFVSSDAGASYNSTTGVWTVGAVPAGGTLTLAVVGTASGPQAATFAAEVSAQDQPDVDSTPNDGTGDDADAVTIGSDSADLRLAVAVDDAAPAIGADVTFSVSVTNDGNLAATGVTVAAPLPAGYTFVSDDAGTAYDEATGVWTVGALAVGATATLEVVATAETLAASTFGAEVSAADQPDRDSTPGNGDAAEDDQDAVAVQAQPIDLSVAVSADDPAPGAGDPVTFTITLANAGPADATGVTVAAPLPAGYTFVSSTPGLSYDDATGVWTVASLASGAQLVLEIAATAGTADARTFAAEVTAADQTDSDSTPNDGTGDDAASVTVGADSADLSLTVAASDAAPDFGADVTFTVAVTNDGVLAATGVTVAAPLPAGYTFVADDAGTAYDEATGVWTIGALAVGATATLEVVATAETLAASTFGAEVSASDQPDHDSTPGNGDAAEDDQDAVAVQARPIDLSVAVSADDPTPAVGDDVTFTVTLANAGPATATGITLAVPLPPDYTFVSVDPGVTYDPGTQTVTVASLTPGAQLAFDLVGEAQTTDPRTFAPEVTAADQPDADSTPNDGTGDDAASVTVGQPPIDLAVSVSVDDAAPAPNGTVAFTVTVTNESAEDASGVVVSAPVPATFAFDSADTGAYNPASGTWTVGAIPAGESRTLTITATVAEDAGTLAAEVTAADQPDADSTPNDGTGDDADAATATPQVVDITLDLVVSDPTPTAGDVVTFTLTVGNDGPVGATGLQVANYLASRPGVFEIVSVTPSVGTFDGEVWDLGALALGDTETLVYEVRLIEDNVAFTSLAEVAAVDQFDTDSTPYNGSTSEDDDASATATTGGSSSGGEGGLESNGSLAQAIATTLVQRRAETALLADAGIALDAAPFVATRLSAGGLRDVIPTAGPGGASAVEVSPFDLLPVTNARDIVAADYLRADGRRVGVVFATATEPGTIYEHTKAVCDRLRGATLAGVELVDVAGHPFVLTRLVQADGSVDYAVSFVAYADGTGRIVDSRFLVGEYAPEGDGEVFNLQVWSPSRAHTVALAADVLAGLAAEGPLAFRNVWQARGPLVLRTAGEARVADAAQPQIPTVFVASAEYDGGRIRLDLHNGGGARTLRVSGGTLARVEGGARQPFDRTLDVPAGTAESPVVSVEVETGYLFDVAFFVESDLNPTPDRLYLADGAWGVAADESSPETTVAAFDVAPETAEAVGAGRRLVERSVAAAGTVATWATVYRTLRAGGQPLDVSGFRYVEFTASGSGEVGVLVQQRSIASADQFGALVRLTPEPRVHRLWFDDLALADGTRGFVGADAVALSFTRRSDGSPVPLDLAVSDVRFGGAEGDDDAAPEAVALWPAMPNPFRGATRLRFELPDAQDVRLRVFDVLGREVARLADGPFEAGRHTLTFDADGLASGLYVARLETGGTAVSRSMTVIR